MAQETKVGLLIGLALILLVGLLLSDLISGGGDDSTTAESATQFGREAQLGIYQQPAPAPSPPSLVSPSGNSPFESDPTPRYEAPAGNATPASTPPAPYPDLPESDIREANGPATQVSQLPSAWHVAPLETVESIEPLAEAGPPQSSPPTGVSVFLQDEPETMGSTFIPPVIDRRAPDPTPTGSGFTHAVRSGETLAEIARHYYNNPDFARAIALANPSSLDRDGRPRVGARLSIPSLGAPVFSQLFASETTGHAEHAPRVEDDAPALPGEPMREPAKPRQIEVKAGDTLSELAAEHLGSAGKWDVLLEANRGVLSSPQALRAGMTLRLPPSEPEIAATRSIPPRPDAIRADEPPTPAAPRSRTYTVRGGDNLTRIAERQLGDGKRWRELLEANADQLKRPEDLRAGMTLKLPGEASTAAAPPAATTRPATPSTASRTYTVRAGDNLSRIARSELGDDDRWRELFEANADQLSSPNDLYAGQVLKLP